MFESEKAARIMRQLRSLPWRRIDACFRGSSTHFFAHNHLQVGHTRYKPPATVTAKCWCLLGFAVSVLSGEALREAQKHSTTLSPIMGANFVHMAVAACCSIETQLMCLSQALMEVNLADLQRYVLEAFL